jgi:hypothetical protein
MTEQAQTSTSTAAPAHAPRQHTDELYKVQEELRKVKRELHIRRVLEDAPLPFFEPKKRRVNDAIVASYKNRVLHNNLQQRIKVYTAERTLYKNKVHTIEGTLHNFKKHTIDDSYNEIAQATGVGKHFIKQVALRNWALSYANASKIAKFFGVDIDDIWYGVYDYVYKDDKWFARDGDGGLVDLP